jgi:uncharacterized protein
MSLLERVRAETSQALKSGDKERVNVLRGLSSELVKAAKEGPDTEVDEISVIRREVKRRREAAQAYRAGGRVDLADAEQREAEMLEGYLPAQLPDDDLHALVDDEIAKLGASSPSDMGKVMSEVMPKVKNQADGRRVSAVVREKLGT